MKLKPLIVLCAIAYSHVGYTQQGGVQDFLNSLRDFESGVNPSLADFYLENYDNPVYTYAQVTSPGRLVRDCATGQMISEPTTIREFFTKIGVNQYYDPTTPYDADMFTKMQYNSTNAWGFIGYQLGEAVLIDSGYYSPTTVDVDGKNYESFYMFVPDSTWQGCKTEALVEVEGSGGNMVYVTDTNRWEGTFTGKNGVKSMADLRTVDGQEMIMRDAMHFNYGIITKLLDDANMTWEQALAKSWPGTDKFGNVVTGYDEQGNVIPVKPTMSGILAAAHLRGAWGTARLLTKDEITCDEINTCITKYVHKFGGYATLFDSPSDNAAIGSKYDELIWAGWGNDVVTLGAGSDTLQLNEQAGSVTTVTDFALGIDRIIIANWSTTNTIPNITVTDTPSGAELLLAEQRVILQGVTATDISVTGLSNVVFESNIYEMAWRGKYVVDGFNPAVDKLKGTAGIGFKHLKAYQTNNSIIIGPQAADGGIYASYELVGLTLAALHPNMFVNVTGSYDRLGFIVPLNSLTWGWNVTLNVGYFDPAKTELTVPSGEPIPFSAVKLSQVGSNTELSLIEPFSKGDKKKIVIANTLVTDFTAANFSGFTGNFSEVTIDIPVYHNATVAISGDGSVLPAPDASGNILVQQGKPFTLEIIPALGNRIESVVIDGQSYGNQSTITLNDVTADLTIQVSFVPGVACPSAWDGGQVYVAGDQAVYAGKIYEAKWWNTGNQPDQGGPWKLVGDCAS